MFFFVYRYLLHYEPMTGVKNPSEKKFTVAADHMRYEREGNNLRRIVACE